MAEPTVRELLEEQIYDAPDTPVVETPAPDVTDAPIETEAQKTERIRDEAGRFAKTDKTEVKVDKPVKEAKVAPVEAAAVQSELTPLQRPSSWKKELWPIWDKMAAGKALTAQESRQVAEYNNSREQQFASGVSTYKQEAERAKPIFEALAPYMGEIELARTDAPTVVRNLLAAQRALALGSPQQKLQMMAQIAQDYGIPLQAFTDQAVQQQYLATPHTPQPQPQLDINQAINNALVQRDLQQTIQQVASNTEKYPFFPYVRLSMAQILEDAAQRGETFDLDEAYQRALELPEHSMLSTAMQQQHTAADEQRRIEAAQKTAKVARANVLSPKSATPAAATATGKTSVREALIEAMSQHGSSARV